MLAQALLVVASALLGCASAVLLLRATLLRRVRSEVAATVQKVAAATLDQAREALSKDAQSAVDALTQLRSERGRVMALLRHRGGKATDDDEEEEGEEGEPDRLDSLLANPVVQGFMQAKGINPALLAGLAEGDPAALMALQQAGGASQSQGEGDAGLLG